MASSVEILSAFRAETRDVDARAFAAFMEHLRKTDPQHTVLMVQVENEIGMLPIARERGAVADKVFARAVPAELMRALGARGEKLEPELLARWKANGSKSSGTGRRCSAPTSGARKFSPPGTTRGSPKRW